MGLEFGFADIPTVLETESNTLGQDWQKWTERSGTQDKLGKGETYESLAVQMFARTYQIVALSSARRIATSQLLQGGELTTDAAEAIRQKALDAYEAFTARTDIKSSKAYNWGLSTKDYRVPEPLERSPYKPGTIEMDRIDSASAMIAIGIGRVNPSLVRPVEYMAVYENGLRTSIAENLRWIGGEMGRAFTKQDMYHIALGVVSQLNEDAIRKRVREHMRVYNKDRAEGTERFFLNFNSLARFWEEAHGELYARFGYITAISREEDRLNSEMSSSEQLRKEVLRSIYFSRFLGKDAKTLFKLGLHNLRIGDSSKAYQELVQIAGVCPEIFPPYRRRQLLGKDDAPTIDNPNANYYTIVTDFIDDRRNDFEEYVAETTGLTFTKGTAEDTNAINILGLDQGRVLYQDSKQKTRRMALAKFVREYHLARGQ